MEAPRQFCPCSSSSPQFAGNVLVIYHWQEFPLTAFSYWRYMYVLLTQTNRKARWSRKAIHKMIPIPCKAPLHVPLGNPCTSRRCLQVIMHCMNTLVILYKPDKKQNNHRQHFVGLAYVPAAVLLCFVPVLWESTWDPVCSFTAKNALAFMPCFGSACVHSSSSVWC